MTYGSDGSAFFDHGSMALLIGTPTRYTHTATEMVEETDVIATANLLRAFVTTAPAATEEAPSLIGMRAAAPRSAPVGPSWNGFRAERLSASSRDQDGGMMADRARLCKPARVVP